MKKKMMLLGTALAITVVFAQAAFANVKHEVKPSGIPISQLDLNQVKQGKFKAIGPVNGSYSAINLAASSLTRSDAVLDLTNVQPGEWKASDR